MTFHLQHVHFLSCPCKLGQANNCAPSLILDEFLIILNWKWSKPFCTNLSLQHSLKISLHSTSMVWIFSKNGITLLSAIVTFCVFICCYREVLWVERMQGTFPLIRGTLNQCYFIGPAMHLFGWLGHKIGGLTLSFWTTFPESVKE